MPFGGAVSRYGNSNSLPQANTTVGAPRLSPAQILTILTLFQQPG
jgi:hypothetical protein